MNVERQMDDGRWLPAEPLPEPFGVLWGRLWHDRRRRGEPKWVALFTSFRDARAIERLTKARAAAILSEAYPQANARRAMCGGGCGEWSPWFPIGDLEDAPPGWTRPREHSWASAPLCPDCMARREAGGAAQ